MRIAITLRAAAALAAAALLSCGGDRGSGPTDAPAPTGFAPGAVLTLVSGDSGAPLAGATVTAGGQVANSDAAGRVRLPSGAPLGSPIEVRHPSILDRLTTVRAGASDRLTLWPRTTASGLSEHYTATLVYTDTTTPPGPTGDSALLRLPRDTRSIAVVPSGSILADDRAMEAHVQGTAAVTEAVGGAVVYSLAPSRPASGVVVTTRVDATDSRCVESSIRAYARSTYAGLVLTSAEIVFCSMGVAQSATIAHELGHTFGLRHSPDDRELMHAQFGNRRATTFGPRESLLMRLMLDRPPGNRYPDDDRNATAAGRTERVTVCY